MVATEKKVFSKWPPEAILKNLLCQYVLHQFVNFDDQNVQYGVFQGAESIGKLFNMTWSKDHAKFKNGRHFYFSKFYFHSYLD